MSALSRSLTTRDTTRWIKWLAIPLFITFVAFLFNAGAPLGRVLWHMPAGSPTPVGLQLPLFLGLMVAQSAALGWGLAFLFFGYPLLRAISPASRGLTVAAFLSTTWYLVNWWLHDNLHMVTPEGALNNLLAIEYGFHVTMMIAGGVLAYFMLTLFRRAATRS